MLRPLPSVSSVVDGGSCAGDVEYLLAHFGSWVPLDPLPLVRAPASSQMGCLPWEPADLYEGSAVLLERGE